MKGVDRMNFLTVEEVALMVDVNKETVRRWIRSGELKATKHSKKEGYEITEESLYDCLQRIGKTKYASKLDYTMPYPIDENSLRQELIHLKRARTKLDNAIQAIEDLLGEG